MGTPIRASAQRLCNLGQLGGVRLDQNVGRAPYLGTPPTGVSQRLRKWGQLGGSLLSTRDPYAGLQQEFLGGKPIKGNSGAWGFRKKGTTGQDSCLPGVGEAPIFLGQHLSPSNLHLGNPEVLAEKFSTPGLR